MSPQASQTPTKTPVTIAAPTGRSRISKVASESPQVAHTPRLLSPGNNQGASDAGGVEALRIRTVFATRVLVGSLEITCAVFQTPVIRKWHASQYGPPTISSPASSQTCQGRLFEGGET